MSRGCPRGCGFCHVEAKEGKRAYKVADLSEFWNGQKYIKLLDPNPTACKEWRDIFRQLAESGAWVDFTQGLDIRLMTEEKIAELMKIKVKQGYYGREISPIGVHRTYEVSDEWTIPGSEYFKELERVSKHQIVWGCNYFKWDFTPGRIVWDKCNGNSSFSDCEIASCSLHDSVRLFRYMWNGMMQGKSIEEGYIQQGNKKLNEKRIHPTQKPVNLYRWLLRKYYRPGWKLLDTHVGSASSLIAFEELKIPYVGFEIDPKCYKDAVQRLEENRAQISIFDYL